MIKHRLLQAALFVSASTYAQLPLRPDSTFNTDGIYQQDFGFQDNLTAVTIQPQDNKIIAVGTAINQTTFGGKLLVIRLNPDGTPDLSFNTTGSVIINTYNESYAYAAQVLPTGKILVAGAVANKQFQFSACAILFNSDGSIATEFGNNGVFLSAATPGDEFAYSMAIQSDQKIVLAGSAGDDQFRAMPAIWRLNADGTPDLSFGNNGVTLMTVENSDNDFSSVLIESSGAIVASGHYDQGLTSGGQQNFDFLTARFLSNGTPDINFGGDGYIETPISFEYSEEAYGMLIAEDGNIVVSGYTLAADLTYDFALMKFRTDGSLDASFGNNGVAIHNLGSGDVIYDMTLQNGKFLCAGTSGSGFDDLDFTMVRFNPNGTLDADFGDNGALLTDIAGGFDEANGLAIQQDGRIVLAGKGNNGLQNDAVVVRYTDQINDVGLEKLENLELQLFPNPAARGSWINLLGLNSSVGSIQLLDLQGRTIVESQLNQVSSGHGFEIPSNISSGMYIIQISSQNKIQHFNVSVK
jgi:uncharacterized delta-60 repeat protein